ncbi:unnamed protein product [Ixodes pacificus]
MQITTQKTRKYFIGLQAEPITLCHQEFGMLSIEIRFSEQSYRQRPEAREQTRVLVPSFEGRCRVCSKATWNISIIFRCQRSRTKKEKHWCPLAFNIIVYSLVAGFVQHDVECIFLAHSF